MEKVYSSFEHQSKNFDPLRTKRYTLCLFVTDGLVISSVLGADGKILFLKEYRSKVTMEIEAFFDAVMKMDYFLKEDYEHVRIITGVLEFTLVPRLFFDAQKTREMARVLINKDSDGDHIEICELKHDSAVAVYTVPQVLKNKFDQYFKLPEYTPFCQAAIDMSFELKKAARNIILVNVVGERFVITGVKDNKLHLCNAYQYHSATDIVYFVQLTVDLLKLSEQPYEIFLTGEFESESELIQQLRKLMPSAKIPIQQLSHSFDTQNEKLPTWKYAFLTY